VSLRVYMSVCIHANKCSTWSSVNCATTPRTRTHTHSPHELVERLICGIHTRINDTGKLVERLICGIHTRINATRKLVERLICGIHTVINATRQLVERRLLVRLTDGSYAPRSTHQLSGHTLSSLLHSHALAPSLPRALAPRQSVRACAHKTTNKGRRTFACPSSLYF
jgi:hypothetical protein